MSGFAFEFNKLDGKPSAQDIADIEADEAQNERETDEDTKRHERREGR